MSTNRLLNGITAHIRSKKILSDVNNRENRCFEGSLSIPNQAFDCLIKKDNEPQTIIFRKAATISLDMIRKNAVSQTHYRKLHNLKDRRLEFLCLGYIDPVGDIVIEDVVSPLNTIILEKIKKEPSITTTELTEYAFSNSIPAIKIKKIMEKSFTDHIMSKDPDNYTLVALRGFTSPQSENEESTTSIQLKDLANSIVPGNLKPQENIVTGVVNLTPPTSKNPNGNIECAIIPHKTKTNGTTTPSKIYNVINALEERNNEQNSVKLTPCPISQSSQDLSGLSQRKYMPVSELEA